MLLHAVRPVVVMMSDPAADLPPFMASFPGAADFSSPSPFDDAQAEVCPPCCWRCMIDVAPLPVTARFCPRCGAGLMDGAGRVLPIPPAAAAAAIVPGSPIDAYTEEGRRRIAAWLWLREALARSAASHPNPVYHRAGARTQIVTGYANAMYHLGTRYESGLPAKRLPGEAARCFIKSARLGNADARARLPDSDRASAD